MIPRELQEIIKKRASQFPFVAVTGPRQRNSRSCSSVLNKNLNSLFW